MVPLTSYQPGTELATIADMSDLIFKGTVDEIDVGKIAVGMPCRIKVGALPEDQVTGELARIAPQAQRSEGATLFDVEIELDPDQEVVLRAGYSANADVVIREKTDIVLIPGAAGALRGRRRVDLRRDSRRGTRSRAGEGDGGARPLGRPQRGDRVRASPRATRSSSGRRERSADARSD